MYEKYFGLRHRPFSITPDPRYLYLSERHREALAHLLYGVGEAGGFVQLTGEVGTGKTTLCRTLLEQLPADVDLALILNPRLDAVELVAAVCDELGVAYPVGSTSLKVLVAALNDFLLQNHAAGRRTVLVIDEAQNLAPEVLEQVRLLTNLETAEIKLLEIVLIGQPELRRLLARDDLRQLAQRITARYHLEPLSREESAAYVRHRLQVAGVEQPLFSARALKALYRLSGGVPRLINIICDRALLGAYVEERPLVDGKILRRAAREVLAEGGDSGWRRRLPFRRPLALALALFLLLLLLPGLFLAQRWLFESPVPVAKQSPVIEPLSAEDNGGAVPALDLPNADALIAFRAGADQADWLTKLDGSADAAAWEALFALWGVELEDDAVPPCGQAPAWGLRCLEGSGNWTLLRRYDRPALLRLTTPTGPTGPTGLTTSSILLLELGEGEAVVMVAGEEIRLALAELDRYWLGEYLLLWRSPLRSELLRQGDQGADVMRLRAILQRLRPTEAVEPEGDPAYFDGRLARQVAAFQAAYNLQPDGIIGIQTLLRLSAELYDPDTPRLTGELSGPITDPGRP